MLSDNGTAVGDNSMIGMNAQNATAIGQDAQALATDATAIGQGSRATFVGATAIGQGAQAINDPTTAVGFMAVASGTNASAFGANAVASGNNSTAIGQGARATATNSAAFGRAAQATRANQVAIGTATNTYTFAGVTSPASRAVQSGPTQLLTTDGNGNIASDGGSYARTIDENTEGVAMAMAMDAPDLRQHERFALKGNWGNFEGENALAFTGTVRLSQRVSFDAGIGIGTNHGNVGGRAGLRIGW